MRAKQFKMSGFIDQEDIGTLFLWDVEIVDSSELKRVRQSFMKTTGHGGMRQPMLHEFKKVSDYMYQYVEPHGRNDYGEATDYLFIFPENHPCFNLDILYPLNKLSDPRLDKLWAVALEQVVVKYLPEYIERNQY